MSALFPRAEYAEDQPLAKTVLTTHVIHRGFQSGVAVGIVTGSIRALARRSTTSAALINNARTPLSTGATGTTTIAPTTTTKAGLIAARPPPSTASVPLLSTNAAHNFSTIARASGRGGAIGAALMAVVLPFYMPAEHVAWQDRSWRLLHNAGQVSVDTWSVAGMLVGGLSVGIRSQDGWRSRGGLWRGVQGLGWQAVLGRMGLGSLVGVLGSMASMELAARFERAKQQEQEQEREQTVGVRGGFVQASI